MLYFVAMPVITGLKKMIIIKCDIFIVALNILYIILWFCLFVVLMLLSFDESPA